MMTDNELHWLAGLLEGEGCFTTKSGDHSRCRVIVKMCDEDVIDKAWELMPDAKKYTIEHKNPKHSTIYSLELMKQEKVVEVMLAVYPLMGKRRKARIDELLEGKYDVR